MFLKRLALSVLSVTGLVASTQSPAAILYDNGTGSQTNAGIITSATYTDFFTLSAATLTGVTFANWPDTGAAAPCRRATL
jgi:hypothetical protein